MLRTKATLAAAATSALVLSVSSANAQNQQLTLCWAAWEPANALAELSKDFAAESGIQMKFEFVPWTDFAAGNGVEGACTPARQAAREPAYGT
jgi:multiple sugar transport system substrate-binding protein